MKLKRFLLRYYPPGIILEYELRDGTREMKEIDLLHLTAEYVRHPQRDLRREEG
jgi:dynein assembly factor with WDR repeat domains 1